MFIRSPEQFFEAVFSKKGPLQKLSRFEIRAGQKEMALLIHNVYQAKEIACIEAGTGTGKSLAYLLPAIYWAIQHKKRTIISTHTIALQEQLMNKDIPFLLKALQVDLKVSLAKGMNNYLCLNKFKALEEQILFFPEQEIRQLQASLKIAKEGTRSEMPFKISETIWNKVSAERDSCDHVRCPYYKECYFFKARKEASESQLIIVNHHLLLADYKSKLQQVKESPLPLYEHLIIDEAHHLELIALQSSAQRFDKLYLLYLLSRLFSETQPEISLCMLIKKDLLAFNRYSLELQQKIEIDLLGQKKACHLQIERVFTQDCFSKIDAKYRITDAFKQSLLWKEEILPSLSALAQELMGLASLMQDLKQELDQYPEEKLHIHALEMHSLKIRLEEESKKVSLFLSNDPSTRRVQWLEKTFQNLAYMSANLNIALFLGKQFFTPLHSAILCSATLTTQNSFSFIKRTLGLDQIDKIVQEKLYPSPFSFDTQALFLIPKDLPLPSDPRFLLHIVQTIEEMIAISRGSVFVLFTSFEMLHNCFQRLQSKIAYPILKQGDLPRNMLLEKFKQTSGQVLFATDSFWEGVDVPGDALRCVIIVKLPFAVPSDPLHEAYIEAMTQDGKNAFLEYSVPQAIIQFKQGFGRLLRSQQDKGCIVCLDHRLLNRSYGKIFLNSLPACKTYFGSKEGVYKEMRDFYKMERSGIEPLTSTMPLLRSTN